MGGKQPNKLKPESQSRTFFSSSLMLDLLFWEFCPEVYDIHSFAIHQALMEREAWHAAIHGVAKSRT